MIGLKRMSRVLMNMVGWTMYRALMFFLYLGTHTTHMLTKCTEHMMKQPTKTDTQL